MWYRASLVGFVMFALLAGPAGAGELKVMSRTSDPAYGQVHDVEQATRDYPGGFVGVDPVTGLQEMLLSGGTLRHAWGTVRPPGGVYISLPGGRIVHFGPRTRTMRDAVVYPGGVKSGELNTHRGDREGKPLRV